MIHIRLKGEKYVHEVVFFKAQNEDNLNEQVGIAKFLCKDLYMEDSIEFQVFHTSVGIIYRVLELGHELKNKMWNNEIFFPQCNYDDRCEVSDEDLPNEKIADEIDNLIMSRCFHIVDIAQRNM